MNFSIAKPKGQASIYLVDDVTALNAFSFTAPEREYIASIMDSKDGEAIIPINHYTHQAFVLHLRPKGTEWQTAEALRKLGAELLPMIERRKLEAVNIQSTSTFPKAAFLLAQGLGLAGYQFLKYKTGKNKKKNALGEISFSKESITKPELEELKATTRAAFRARTLVNEPVIFLTATQLAEEMSAMAKESGVKATVFNKAQIEKEKMGGLLAVNIGSTEPPTFTILEYKPAKARNKKPIVLVGKGVVYDTGGLSLKPTPASMDRMKSDMSGAALAATAICAAAEMALPLHIIALVPATDNRPGGNAYTPGDVITISDGTTVEVLNTDAEGRLILADALQWAKQYKPELVMDFATLTGAASVAVGEHGIVCMGTAGEEAKQALRDAGLRQYERLVEYPLWDEYGEQIKSDIADLKNIGGPNGGAITAGKFLQHFTDYPWMHFDIAGVSFAMARKHYLTPGGTAYGLRMVLDFLRNYAQG